MFSVPSLLLGSLLFKTIFCALPFHELVLQMPAREDASNKEEEHCLCISVLLDPNKRYHIVSFAPIGVHENVNHMALVSGVGFPSFCKEDKEKASNSKHGNGLKSGNEIWYLEGWQCSMGGGRAGETWQALDSRTLYIWGQRAGGRGLVLPRDTALSVGGREDERLVLQVHFKEGQAGSVGAGVRVRSRSSNLALGRAFSPSMRAGLSCHSAKPTWRQAVP